MDFRDRNCRRRSFCQHRIQHGSVKIHIWLQWGDGPVLVGVANVLLQEDDIAEGLWAHGTLMRGPHWSFYFMNAHMRFQISFRGESP